jgi:hypothetical protein
MPKLTKKQFADLCGMPTNRLAIYIQRKKIEVEDNEIDINNEHNRLFLEKYAKKESYVSPKKEKKKPEPTVIINLEPETISETPKERTNLTLTQLEREKKLADLQKVEVDTRIAKLREEKLMGQNIPTELVKGVVSQMSKSFVSKFKDGAENILISVSKMKGLSNEEMAKLRGELVAIINESIKSSVNDCKKQVSTIVATYSNSRGVGEHD